MSISLLRCQFCGMEGPVEDFEFDYINKDGFWCPDCDGHTFINNVNNIKRISLLRYPGGKSKLIDYLYVKLQKSKCKTFIEPYAGGGSVGLALLNANVVENIVLNDLDFGIYSLYYLAVHDPHELIEMINNTTPNYDDYYNAQNIVIGKYINCDKLTAAWSCLITNRLSYSGIYKAGPLGGKKSHNLSKLLSRWNPKELIKRINIINNLSERITVSNIPAEELLAEMYYDETSTILIDPPYYEKGIDLYLHYYNKEQHLSLSNLLDSLYMNIPGADIILTYDNHQYINDIYKTPSIEKISRIYSI